MKGRPFIYWLVFAVMWSLLVIPLVLVTTGAPEQKADDARVESENETWVSLRFSAVPETFSLLQNGALLWSIEDSEKTRHEKMIPLVFDEYGTDLEIRARFSLEEVAAEILLTPDGRDERARTIWINDEAERRISFIWGNAND